MISEKLNWKAVNVYLLVAVIIGTVLRLYKLGAQSFWIDEVFSVTIVRHGFYEFNNPPLSYVIIWLFIETLGTNEFVARLSSCIFGIMTIPLVYIFGKQLFSEKEGLMASFIISLSPWYIRWSQEARMYTQLTVFTILALYFFYKATYKESIKFYLISSLFMILAFYTHFSAILILGIVTLWLISRKFLDNVNSRTNYLHLAIFFSLFFLLCMPLFFTHIPYAIEDKFGGSIIRWGAATIGYYILSLFSNEFGPILSLFSILSAILIILRRNFNGILLIIYAIVPFLTFTLSILVMNVALTYLLYTLPAYALLTSHLLIEISEKLKKSEADKELYIKVLKGMQTNEILSIGVVLAIIIGMSNLQSLYYYYSYGNHPDWKAACLFVESEMSQDDLVVSTVNITVNYYLGQLDYELSKENIDIIRNSERRVWLLIDDWRIDRIDPNYEIRDWIDSNCRKMERVNLITIYLFTPSNN